MRVSEGSCALSKGDLKKEGRLELGWIGTDGKEEGAIEQGDEAGKNEVPQQRF